MLSLEACLGRPGGNQPPLFPVALSPLIPLLLATLDNPVPTPTLTFLVTLEHANLTVCPSMVPVFPFCPASRATMAKLI